MGQIGEPIKGMTDFPEGERGVIVTERLFKVLAIGGEAHYGGTGKWNLPAGKRPGKWMTPIENPVPCVRGYHLCRETDLIHWLGPVIYEAEARGIIVEDDKKIVAAEARLIRRVTTWNEATARLFAADCAEAVLDLFERRDAFSPAPRRAIEAARKFARGEISPEELSAAWSAAESAARSAAESAATVRLFEYLDEAVGNRI